MATKEKFNKLKERELSARSNSELELIHAEFEKMADEDPNGFEAAFLESMRGTLRAAKQLRIKEQMLAVSNIISMAYIAETYFHKSKSWLSQRINELNVNGKPAQFTPEEIDTLNFAFKDIAEKIGAFRISC